MLNYMAISFIWQWKFHRKSLLVLVRSCFLMVKTEGFVHPYRNVKTASKRSKFALAKAVGVLLLISTETGFRLNDFPGMCCGLVDYTWPYYVVRSITQHNLVLSRVGYFVLSKQSFKRFLCHETLRFFIMETKNEKKKKVAFLNRVSIFSAFWSIELTKLTVFLSQSSSILLSQQQHFPLWKFFTQVTHAVFPPNYRSPLARLYSQQWESSPSKQVLCWPIEDNGPQSQTQRTTRKFGHVSISTSWISQVNIDLQHTSYSTLHITWRCRWMLTEVVCSL